MRLLYSRDRCMASRFLLLTRYGIIFDVILSEAKDLEEEDYEKGRIN